MCIVCAIQGLGAFAATDETGIGTDATPMEASRLGMGATGNPYVDGLLSGHRWSGTITYSFPAAVAAYETGITETTNGFRQVSFAQMQAARHILDGTSGASGGPRMAMTAFEQFAAVTIGDNGTGGGDIRIATSTSANPTAYAYYPSTNPRGGDVWFGTSYDYTGPQVGNYAYATMIHELGHALGLKHGQQAGGPANVALPADRDSMEFSVMTYRSYIGAPLTGYTNETYGFAQTYMMNDIAALQAMYGANFNTQSGNTVYSWSPTTGETFIDGVGQGAAGGGAGGSANRTFLTVWDGGGTDTYDLSNYATNLKLDLSPGGWSTLSQAQLANLGNGNYARGNVFNALQYEGNPRSLIENAIGGAGHDLVQGNAAANLLAGGGGNDTLIGGVGEDTLDGGSGSDTVWLVGSRSNYSVSAGTDGSARVVDLRVGSPEGTDTVRDVEFLRFADGTFDFAAVLTPPKPWSAASGWTSQDRYTRLLADTNGDGRADIVAFASDGVYVALADGSGGFGAGSKVYAGFGSGPGAGGWASQELYARQMADTNGDGRADIVAFASDGVYVALANGSGGFGAATRAYSGFGANAAAGGWTSQDRFPRQMIDANKDGRADIVAFASDGVYIALADGAGGFGAATKVYSGFGASSDAGGWTSQNLYARQMADANGDGFADIVAFASDGVYISYADTCGGYWAASKVYAGFGASAAAGGWRSQDEFPRLTADMNGDGRADIVAFAADGAYVAFSQGLFSYEAGQKVVNGFGAGAGNWTSQDATPRLLADVTGDGAADIVGFGQVDVQTAISAGWHIV